MARSNVSTFKYELYHILTWRVERADRRRRRDPHPAYTRAVTGPLRRRMYKALSVNDSIKLHGALLGSLASSWSESRESARTQRRKCLSLRGRGGALNAFAINHA